ncbi:MAG: leucine-rich repeat domain-containing protein [Verrucomicrobia subdivision 3 bacterium]|nr:leucine-rich repeat domain-containing protein [Limisphaerales bacterium]
MRFFWIPVIGLLAVGCSSEADKLEEKAMAGDVSAQFDLATLFEAAEEGEADLVQAYKWYAIASTNGDVVAGENLRDCAENMSAKQIAVAQKLVASWVKIHPPQFTKPTQTNQPKVKPKRLSPQERVEAAVRAGLDMPMDAALTPADWARVTKLDLASMRLRDLSLLAQCHALREVDLGRNGLSNLTPLAGLSKLEVIYAYENRIADLKPLAKLTALRELQLSINPPINDLQPLANLAQLEVLELDSCGATNLQPLARLTQLRRLVLTSNKATDVTPLYSLTKLRFLSIKHCPIPPAQAAALRKALPNCKIFGP